MDPTTPTFTLRQNGGANCLVNCHVFAKPEHISELERQLAGRPSTALTLHAIAGGAQSGTVVSRSFSEGTL